MKAKDAARLLANRINQEHYILHIMQKVYNEGLENGKKEALHLHGVMPSLPFIEKIIKSRIADSFDNGMQNFEKNELLNALDAIKRLVPPSYFDGNVA